MNRKVILKLGFAFLLGFLTFEYFLQNQLTEIYQNQKSLVVLDRFDRTIFVKENQKGSYGFYINFSEIPENFRKLLLKKEDRFFYWHFGFNPISIAKETLGYFGIGFRKGSSTISQQLVKNLLEKENKRTTYNKFIESFYVLGLEIFQSKNKVLEMYVNTAYFGNKAQGLKQASQTYFQVNPELLTQSQMLQLLATLSNPNWQNPSQPLNQELASELALHFKIPKETIIFTTSQEAKQNLSQNQQTSKNSFELNSYLKKQECQTQIQKTGQPPFLSLTIDKNLTDKIRQILSDNIEIFKDKNANHGSAIVIKLPENEILSLVGSPNPLSYEHGYQINMLEKPRSIGSTVKPFIYLKAFESGLRPYTLIDDREYRYTGYDNLPLYPQNYDWKFNGIVSLHYALSNSLNVPSLKVLEYIGLNNFFGFLQNSLGFKPEQNLSNYQLSAALGSLEISLFDLAHYFTIFPNKGELKELTLCNTGEKTLPKKIADEQYIEIVNKILSDRKTGIAQFGLVSDLNLFQKNYGLKTGTSKDYKDSWVIGFTPDFLVGVWLGNADNTSMDELSGQLGAGRIWAEIMDVLLNSQYNKKTEFDFGLLKEFPSEDGIDYGLASDNYENIKNMLIVKDTALILNPHQNDIFLWEKTTQIPLKAKEKVNWFVNPLPKSEASPEQFLGFDSEIIFKPPSPGAYQIKAQNSTQSQTIEITLNQ